MVVYSGSNTDCKSSEPLKTIVMLCYVMLCYIRNGKGLYICEALVSIHAGHGLIHGQLTVSACISLSLDVRASRGDCEPGLRRSLRGLSRNVANLKTPGYRPALRRSWQASRSKRSPSDPGAITPVR